MGTLLGLFVGSIMHDVGVKVMRCLVVFLLWESATAREWTNSEGRTIEAEFVEIEGDKVVLEMNGKTYKVALDSLTEDDREFARSAAEEGGAKEEVAPAEGLKLADQAVEAGKTQQLDVELSAENQEIAREGLRGWRDSYKENYAGSGGWFNTINDGHEVARMNLTVGLPPGFDPASGKEWPIFVSFSNVQAAGGHCPGSGIYWNACREKGWVLLAFDPKPDAKKLCSTPVMMACAKQAFEELHAAWPESKTWPIVVGGSSGGAKFSTWMGPLISELPETDVRGLFLSACNEAHFFDYAKGDLKVGRKTIRELKVVLSTGTKDNLVSEAQREQVLDQIDGSGIREVHSLLHDGGHGLNQEQLRDALDWLVAEDPA